MIGDGGNFTNKIDTIDGLHDVPSRDSDDNVNMRDVVGNKLDLVVVPYVPHDDSMMAFIRAGYYHAHGASFVYPDKAVPVTLTSAVASWAETGAITEIIPADTIVKDFDLHWCSISDISATLDGIIDIFSGDAGLKERWRNYTGYVFILVIYFLIRSLALQAVFSGADKGFFVNKAFTVRAGTMIRVFANYLKMMVLPFSLKPDYEDFRLSESLFEIDVIVAFVVIASVITGAVLMHKRHRMPAFTTGFFFIMLIPVTNIIFWEGFNLLFVEDTYEEATRTNKHT